MKIAKRSCVAGIWSSRSVVAAAALAAVPCVLQAADVTLSASDAAGTSSFNTGLHWSDTNAPAAGNNYIVNGAAANLSLRTPVDSSTDVTFAGDSLTLSGASTSINGILVIKNLTNINTTVNNLTLNGGRVQNGGSSTGAATTETLTSNNITLSGVGGVLDAGTAGRVLIVNAPLTGSGPLLVANNGGLVTLTGTNTYMGATTISGSSFTGGLAVGSLRANDGAQIGSANLALGGGVLESSTNMVRALGTDAGQVQITGGVSGFSAVGADTTVSLGGVGTAAGLSWGSATFNPSMLVLNNSNATNNLTFANAIDLGTASRTIFTGAGVATLTGTLSSTTATTGLTVYGNGILVLSTANAFSGSVTLAGNNNNTVMSTAGTVRATASDALGTGTITIGLSGNATSGRLELANNAVLSNPISLPSRAGTSVAIQNISGNNELSGTIAITSGGANNIVQSDAGTLTLSGASTAAGGFAIQSATGARTVTLQGSGNGVVSGIIRDSNAISGATIAITKAGTGTWTLTNANTYTGATTVNAGTLQLGDGTSGHDGTIASTSVVNNGTLAYNRFGNATASYVISGTGGVSKLGAGTQILSGANTYSGTTSISAGTLQATSTAYNSNLLANSAGVDLIGSSGKLVLDYTGTTSPASTVGTILSNGYAGNFASGQIKSSTLASGRTIGYADDGVSAVTIRVTLPGDADLNGKVDFNDFLVLQAKFGQTGTRFDQGNFNYDNVTDFNDFLALQANFGQSISGAAVPVTASEVAAMTAFANTVPEPTSLAVLGLGGLLLGRRRRSR